MKSNWRRNRDVYLALDWLLRSEEANHITRSRGHLMPKLETGHLPGESDPCPQGCDLVLRQKQTAGTQCEHHNMHDLRRKEAVLVYRWVPLDPNMLNSKLEFIV